MFCPAYAALLSFDCSDGRVDVAVPEIAYSYLRFSLRSGLVLVA
jgi:hypothetical protein